MIIDKEKLMNVMSVHDPKEKSGAEHKYWLNWLIVGGGYMYGIRGPSYLHLQTGRGVCLCSVCVWGGGYN